MSKCDFRVEVIGMLASMVLACDVPDFTPIDHMETFAGACAVTKAEMEAGVHARVNRATTAISYLFHIIYRTSFYTASPGWKECGAL